MIKVKKYNQTDAQMVEDLDRLVCESADIDGFKTEISLDASLNVKKEMASIYTAEKDGKMVALQFVFAPTLSEIEVDTLVHPNHRKEGIFKELIKEAVRECLDFGYQEGLFEYNDASNAAAQIMSHWDCPIHHTEYQMEYTIKKPIHSACEELVLVEASIDDLEALAEIAASIFSLDIESERQILNESIRSQELKQWVLKKGNKILGLCAIAPKENQFNIFGLGVCPDERRKGYARALLDFIAEDAASQGIKKLCLDVDSSNPGAINLYRKFGFIDTSVTRYHRFEFSQFVQS